MKRLNKKGQTEDFVADLIPSLIIIAIGLYVLSGMNDVNEGMVNEVSLKLDKYMEYEEKTVADYLSQNVEVEGKKMSLAELISLSYRNEEYQREVMKKLGSWEEELEFSPEAIAPTTKQEVAETIAGEMKECTATEITYPDGSVLKIGEDCTGGKKSLALPSYGGEYIKVDLIIGSIQV